MASETIYTDALTNATYVGASGTITGTIQPVLGVSNVQTFISAGPATWIKPSSGTWVKEFIATPELAEARSPPGSFL